MHGHCSQLGVRFCSKDMHGERAQHIGCVVPVHDGKFVTNTIRKGAIFFFSR